MGAVSLDERHRARIERMMMEEEEAKELEVEVTNIHHFSYPICPSTLFDHSR